MSSTTAAASPATSDVIFIPSADIGAVLLINSDDGQSMLRPFMRRLLELLYDGKPEAAADVTASAARIKAQVAKEAELVSRVADKDTVAALAPSYYPAQGAAKLSRRYSFHALRHYAANSFIAQRTELKRLSGWLGHSTVTLTLNRYGHLMKDTQQDASIIAAAEAHLFG